MNLIEILKAKGVNDELIAAIQEDMKANSIYTASEENLDIRYGKLKTQHEGQSKQLEEANALIETLKKSTKGQEDAQQRITAYETEIEKLKAQLVATQIDADVQVRLLAEGVKPDDIDYVMFKLKAKGELEMGDDGKVKGLDDKVAALKTQLPNQFTAETKKKVLENRLPTGSDNGDAVTKESILRKPYAERMKMYAENPEAYKAAMETK